MAKTFSQSPTATALRVGGQVLLEKITRSKVYLAEEVPGSPYAITTQWLTDAVCKGVPGAQATDVKVDLVSSGTHERHRLHVSYNEAGTKAGLPRSIFAKSLPSLVTRMIAGFTAQARSESMFYKQIRPQLSIETPLCYYTGFDKNKLAALHLMEDLVATKSATFCSNRTDVTRTMADDMIDLLASLHASFHRKLDDRKTYSWLPGYPQWFTVGAEKLRIEHYTQKALDKAADVMPSGLMKRRHDLWPATMRALEVHNTHSPVFLHSDVHIGNWYKVGTRMGLCDWQCASRGHWSRDVSYMLAASLSPENRRKWEKDLVARYVARFSELTGEKLEFEQGFTWYRQQMLHALPMWTITLCHSRLLPAMQSDEMTLEMVRRLAIAVDDLDSIGSA
jgi:hypothetical protein